MVNEAIIGQTLVPHWHDIEELMIDQPMGWFSCDELIEVTGVGDKVKKKSIQNMVYRLARIGVLRVEGKKGSKLYRLADSYVVAVVISSRY